MNKQVFLKKLKKIPDKEMTVLFFDNGYLQSEAQMTISELINVINNDQEFDDKIFSARITDSHVEISL